MDCAQIQEDFQVLLKKIIAVWKLCGFAAQELYQLSYSITTVISSDQTLIIKSGFFFQIYRINYWFCRVDSFDH